MSTSRSETSPHQHAPHQISTAHQPQLRRKSALRRGLQLLLACAGLATLVSPANAQLLETRVLYANSYCAHPVRIMVLHKDSTHAHHVHAWYEFRPYQESRLEDRGVVLRQVVGADLYFYAETLTGGNTPALTWRGNDATGTFNNVNYPMRRTTLTVNARGELEFSLTCN